MAVEMKPVKSSNILSVGLDPATGEMHVAFVSGGQYIHSGVSLDQYNGLIGADSVGSHYHHNFRGNPGHPVRKHEKESGP